MNLYYLDQLRVYLSWFILYFDDLIFTREEDVVVTSLVEEGDDEDVVVTSLVDHDVEVPVVIEGDDTRYVPI